MKYKKWSIAEKLEILAFVYEPPIKVPDRKHR